MGAGLKTCPQFYARDPDVHYILSNLEDYKRGALGPIGRLPAHVVDYLRAAESSRNKWLESNQMDPS